jgi:hypothetical protein
MKTKYRYLFIVVLLLLPICQALTDLKECAGELEPSDVPCQVTTLWILPEPCVSYQVNITDENATQVLLINLTEFGQYCAFTWNITTPGAFYYRIPNADTGQINILYKMEILQGVLVYGLYLFVVLVLIILIHVFKQDKGTPIVYGVIASVWSFIFAGVLLSGFQVIKNVNFIFNINYYLVALTVGIGLYTTSLALTFYKDLKEENTEA